MTWYARPPIEGGDGHDDHPVAHQDRVLARPAGQADQDLVRHRQADRIADPVPVDGERSELEGDRIRHEIEHPPKCTGPAPYTRRQ